MSEVAAQETAAQETPAAPWWLVLIEGVALVILGILLITNTGKTAVIFVQVIGIYWIMRGIFYIVAIFIDSTQWGLKLALGILGIIAGILVLNHPLISPLALGNAIIIILGIYGILAGIFDLIAAFQGEGWGRGILGVVMLILSIWLLGNLNNFGTAFAVWWAGGVLAIIGGLIAVVGAFRMK